MHGREDLDLMSNLSSHNLILKQSLSLSSPSLKNLRARTKLHKDSQTNVTRQSVVNPESVVCTPSPPQNLR